MKKRLNTLLSLALLMSLVVPSVVFAQSQTETVTFSGHSIKCSLVCDFHLTTNDNATAKSNWGGMNGYQVGVTLYQRQSSSEPFIGLDTDYGDIGAITKGSVDGVWKYKSVHKVRKNSDKAVTKVCELTDW